jgi:hypothetical protein
MCQQQRATTGPCSLQQFAALALVAVLQVTQVSQTMQPSQEPFLFIHPGALLMKAAKANQNVCPVWPQTTGRFGTGTIITAIQYVSNCSLNVGDQKHLIYM